jgi:hypothetical protein
LLLLFWWWQHLSFVAVLGVGYLVTRQFFFGPKFELQIRLCEKMQIWRWEWLERQSDFFFFFFFFVLECFSRWIPEKEKAAESTEDEVLVLALALGEKPRYRIGRALLRQLGKEMRGYGFRLFMLGMDNTMPGGKIVIENNDTLLLGGAENSNNFFCLP